VLAETSQQKNNINLFETTDMMGCTPAYIAIERNFSICVDILANAGADLR
jgi:hypothetical protein